MPKKKDLILIAVLLCVSLAGLGIIRLLQTGEGAYVTVTVGGEVYGTYELDCSQVIEVDDDLGYNRIVIDDGYVYMESADCPDLYCVKHARIHNSHESIICLPHELVVEITGGGTADVDAVAQ